MPVELTRQDIERKLGQVFRPSQVSKLLEVLETFRKPGGEDTAGPAPCPESLEPLVEGIAQLTAAQQQVHQCLVELEERTAQCFSLLAEGQRRTDQLLATLITARQGTRETASSRMVIDNSETRQRKTGSRDCRSSSLPVRPARQCGISPLGVEQQHFDPSDG